MTIDCPICRGGADAEPRECLDCDGSGTEKRSGSRCGKCRGTGGVPWCWACGGPGQYLAQLCLSVVNVVTAEVASELLVAGDLPVEPHSGNPKRRVVDVGPVVARLAGEVGVASFVADDRVYTPKDGDFITMPEAWRDDAPVEQRRLWQAEAFADTHGTNRWRIVLGSPPDGGTGKEPGPDETWAALRDFASAACLDLVVRRVDDYWSVHYELPDAVIKADDEDELWLYLHGLPDLEEAVTWTSPAALVADMRQIAAPGYRVTGPGRDTPEDETTGWTIADVAEAVKTAATSTGTAMAVWRDNRWHVRAATLAVQPEGAVTVPDSPIPTPRWRGEPLLEKDCGCTDDGETCRRCRGQKVRRSQAVVTLVFPDNRVSVHNLLMSRPAAAALGGCLLRWERGPGRRPRPTSVNPWVDLPAELTLAHVLQAAGAKGWRPMKPAISPTFRGTFLPPDAPVSNGEHLGEQRPSPLPRPDDPRWSDLNDLVGNAGVEVFENYVRDLTGGYPGGRAFFAVVPPAADTSLGRFTSLARNLGARLDLTVDPSRTPTLWAIELSSGAEDRTGRPHALEPLGEAIAEVVRDLPVILARLGNDIPADRPLPLPRRIGTPTAHEDDVDVAERLARWAGAAPAWATCTPSGWTVRHIELLRPHGSRLGAQASGETLAQALANPTTGPPP